MKDFNEYINLEDALKRMRGNATLYKRMVKLFIENKEFGELKIQLAQKDYAKAAETIHTIKGMTGNLSFTKLFEISVKMLEAFRSNNIDIIENGLADEIWEVYDKTLAYAQEYQKADYAA